MKKPPEDKPIFQAHSQAVVPLFWGIDSKGFTTNRRKSFFLYRDLGSRHSAPDKGAVVAVNDKRGDRSSSTDMTEEFVTANHYRANIAWGRQRSRRRFGIPTLLSSRCDAAAQSRFASKQ